MTDYALHSIKTRELWFNPDLLNERYASRLVKYATRGFKIHCPGYVSDVQFQGCDVVRSLIYGFMVEDNHIRYYTSGVSVSDMTIPDHERTTSLVSESYEISEYIDVMISRLEEISGLIVQYLRDDRDFIKKLVALLVRSGRWNGLTHEDITTSTNEEITLLLVKFIAQYIRHSDLFCHDPESIIMLASKGIYINRSLDYDYSFISCANENVVESLVIEGTKLSLYRSEECSQKNGTEIEFQGYTGPCITSNLGCKAVIDDDASGEMQSIID
jgi:hypothetical protein